MTYFGFSRQLTAVLVCVTCMAYAQAPELIRTLYPEATTIVHSNVPYAGDTLKKHLLDIYIPRQAKGSMPLVIWVHGGGWMHNDKYADMSYMQSTIRALLDKGYALASIDYRHSTTRIFPAQIQDCYQAVEYLYQHAAEYRFDRDRFVMMGFSAGGHLASLLGLSLNNHVQAFYPANRKPTFRIRAVVDYYGPSNFLMFFGDGTPAAVDNPVAILLGASPLARPDLSNQASPVTYVDPNDPPFFIVNGEKDHDVPPAQSYLLKSYLDLAKVKNELTIVKDAPHYGVMFDAEDIRQKLLTFLDNQLK
jgi:acetyl esterase/lipase